MPKKTFRHVADQMRDRWPRLAAFMDASEHDVLAYMGFPAQHRTKLHSTNTLERLTIGHLMRSTILYHLDGHDPTLSK
jgi:transposase-like protein